MDPGSEVRRYTYAKLRKEKPNPTLSRAMVVGQNEMHGHIQLKRGSIVPPREHMSEQITIVRRGALRLGFGGRKTTVRVGQAPVILPNVSHGATAL